MLCYSCNCHEAEYLFNNSKLCERCFLERTAYDPDVRFRMEFHVKYYIKDEEIEEKDVISTLLSLNYGKKL